MFFGFKNYSACPAYVGVINYSVIKSFYANYFVNNFINGVFNYLFFYSYYFDRIILTPELNHWFSLAPNDPELGSGVFYGRIDGHHGVHYSTHNGTEQKIRNINNIGELLNIDVLVHAFE